MNVVVLASGAGSNLRALHGFLQAAKVPARISGVVSDKNHAEALGFAAAHGIPTKSVSLKRGESRDQWNIALGESVAAFHPDLVVLAGFMRVVSIDFLDRFPRRVINVHPSLLPSFRGIDAVRQAIRANVCISGCSVHQVDASVDTGPIIAQAAVIVPQPAVSPYPNQEPTCEALLHARIREAEHRLLPWVVKAIAEGGLQLEPDIRWDPVWLRDHALPPLSHILIAPQG